MHVVPNRALQRNGFLVAFRARRIAVDANLDTYPVPVLVSVGAHVRSLLPVAETILPVVIFRAVPRVDAVVSLHSVPTRAFHGLDDTSIALANASRWTLDFRQHAATVALNVVGRADRSLVAAELLVVVQFIVQGAGFNAVGARTVATSSDVHRFLELVVLQLLVAP